VRSTTRAAVVAAGGAAALLGYYFVPGLYAVRYSPPAGAPHAGAALNRLRGFPSLGDKHLVLYGNDNAPGLFVLTLVAVIVVIVAALGLAVVDGRAKSGRWPVWLRWAGGAGLGLLLLQFLWSFLTGVPKQVTSAFVADLGGKADAVAAARHLSPLPSFGAVAVVVGVFIMVAAFYPRIGIAGAVLTVIGGFLVGLGWRGTIATLGPILCVLFLLYMFFFRLSVVFSFFRLIFSSSVLFWGLSVIWQGTGHKVPLFDGGRALVMRWHGKDVDGNIYVAVGLGGALLGLILVVRSLGAIVRNWREGAEDWLSEPGIPSPPSPSSSQIVYTEDKNLLNPAEGRRMVIQDENGTRTIDL